MPAGETAVQWTSLLTHSEAPLYTPPNVVIKSHKERNVENRRGWYES